MIGDHFGSVKTESALEYTLYGLCNRVGWVDFFTFVGQFGYDYAAS